MNKKQENLKLFFMLVLAAIVVVFLMKNSVAWFNSQQYLEEELWRVCLTWSTETKKSELCKLVYDTKYTIDHELAWKKIIYYLISKSING